MTSSNARVCARTSLADHRTTAKRQRRATEGVIAFERPGHPFVRHPAIGRLLAKEN